MSYLLNRVAEVVVAEGSDARCGTVDDEDEEVAVDGEVMEMLLCLLVALACVDVLIFSIKF